MKTSPVPTICRFCGKPVSECVMYNPQLSQGTIEAFRSFMRVAPPPSPEGMLR